MNRRIVYAFFSLLLCACASGCGLIRIFGRSADNGAELDEADSKTVYFDGIPRVRPGVVIAVQVGAPSQSPVSFQVQVSSKGDVTFPYLLESPIQCDGQTLEELKQTILKEYSEYIHQPVINVSFVPVSGNEGVSPYGTVLVLGQVGAPGPVNMPATMDLTITKAIKLAGGLKPFADRGCIYVSSRDKSGAIHRTKVDIDDIGKYGDISMDISLSAGNVVWVKEAWW